MTSLSRNNLLGKFKLLMLNSSAVKVKNASTSSATSASQVGLKKDEASIVVESAVGQTNVVAPESGASITSNDKKEKEKPTFAKLFKESKFVSLSGTPNPRLIGKIIHVVNDDLYIDYGGKFNCICKRPRRNSHLYMRNTNVEIKLKSFEMASYFLNSAKHLTLLESDAEVVGVVSTKNPSIDEQVKSEIDELNSEENYL